MHPFFQNRTLLISYLAGWTVPTFLLLNVFIIGGEVPPGKAFLFVIPLSLGFAALGVPIYYVCRANPLGGSRYPKALTAHLVGSVFYGTLWQLIARFSAEAIKSTSWGADFGAVWGLTGLIFGTGMLAYLLTAGVFYVNLAGERSHQAERAQAQLEVQASGAELQALRSQVNPHFLFNSLHSISALTIQNPEKARVMCVRLADLLRLTLGLGDKRLISMEKEFEIVESYLEIEQARLGERLEVDLQIAEDCRKLQVPPLVVQPLVENAILHGIATLPEGGKLEVQVFRSMGGLTLRVCNPFDPLAPRRPGTGTGQKNLQARIRNQFGQEAAFRTSRDGGRYEAVIKLPLIGGAA